MNRIRQVRKMLGIAQKELALKASVSQPYLHDLELGARGAKPETWGRIAEALGVRVEDLKVEDKTA